MREAIKNASRDTVLRIMARSCFEKWADISMKAVRDLVEGR